MNPLRPPQSRVQDGIITQTARAQICQSDRLPLWAVPQSLLSVDQISPRRILPGVTWRWFLLRGCLQRERGVAVNHRTARPYQRRRPLERLGEIEVIALLQPGERITMRATSKTLIRAPLRSDRETRLMIWVKRTQPAQPGPRFLWWSEIILNEFDQVKPRLDLCNVNHRRSHPPRVRKTSD
ncbi:MAG: hypothetical protein BWY63_03926 [Chloroflexi bacterium ADurb.Bin360]|nr:MAG: hypothetical protein BWY63_03926 [Chloroflexi bacterium ADurb.Bin360]